MCANGDASAAWNSQPQMDAGNQGVHVACRSTLLKSIGYTWSHLACRIGQVTHGALHRLPRNVDNTTGWQPTNGKP
jgi:hypothetical protein